MDEESKYPSEILVPQEIYDYCLTISRLSALGRMSNFVMHEIRNSLTIIYSAVQLVQLKADSLTPAELTERLDQVLEQTDAIQRIISKVGRLSERERGVEITFHPDKCLDTVLESMDQRITRSGIAITRTKCASINHVSCEASLLDFILFELLDQFLPKSKVKGALNLLSNADEHSWYLQASFDNFKSALIPKDSNDFQYQLIERAVKRLNSSIVRTKDGIGWTLSIPWAK